MASGRANFRKRAEKLQKQDNPFAKKHRNDSQNENTINKTVELRQRRLALVRSNADIALEQEPVEERSRKQRRDVDEIYREVMLKSKQHKMARQALKEADEAITSRLDESLLNVVSSLGLRDATAARMGVNDENTFKALKDDLVYDKHIVGGERVKTAEEEAEAAREALVAETKKREARKHSMNATDEVEDDFGDVLSDDFVMNEESLGSEDVEFEDDNQLPDIDEVSDDDIEAKEGVTVETSLEEFLEMTEDLDELKAILKAVELGNSRDIALVSHVMSLLVESLLVKCDSEDITKETVAVYFKSIYYLANSGPVEIAKYIRRSLAALIHSMSQSLHKSVLSLKGLILIRLSFAIFPPFDAWHSVATAAFLVGEFVASYTLYDSPKALISSLFLAESLFTALEPSQFSIAPLTIVTKIWKNLDSIEFTGEKSPLKLAYLVPGVEVGDCLDSFLESLQKLTMMIIDFASQSNQVNFVEIMQPLRSVLESIDQKDLVDLIDRVSERIISRRTGINFIKEKTVKIKEYEPRISSKFK